ncbi:MAG: DUF2232 domain-containing protein [Gemmatimonadota bacterium]
MAVAPREQGWWRLLLAVAIALSVPWVAQLRVMIPVEQTILLIAPAMAACALASWGSGGRVMTFIAWGLLAGWMLTLAVPGAGRFDPLTRGWALILAASFALVSLVGQRSTFLKRGLSALAVAFVCTAVVAIASGVRLEDLGRAVSGEFARRLDVVTQSLEQRMQTREWQDFAERFPGGAEIVAQGEQQLPRLARYAISLFPALLALESLAILGLAWSLYHRASRSRIGPPIARLSEFRFNDQFVWGVIAGVALATVPALSELRPLGLNLLVFFGALYALRGLGVLAWFVAPGKPTPILLVLATVIAAPFVGVFAAGLGLVDTWLDWRSRVRPPAVT